MHTDEHWGTLGTGNWGTLGDTKAHRCTLGNIGIWDLGFGTPMHTGDWGKDIVMHCRIHHSVFGFECSMYHFCNPKMGD